MAEKEKKDSLDNHKTQWHMAFTPAMKLDQIPDGSYGQRTGSYLTN